MSWAWGLGQVVEFVRGTSDEEARLGRTLVLFGALSFVGGAGILALTGVLRIATEDVWTFRTFAGILVGAGLPAFLYGLVVLSEGAERTADVGRAGILLCSMAVIGFVVTYPGQWTVAGTSGYAVVTLVLYGLGTMLCSAATGGAILANLDAVEEPDETGFVWGNPPES